MPTEGGIANELENTPDIDVDEIRKDEPEECKEGLEMPLEITVGLAAIACLVQLLFDSFAELVLKCSCFQKGCGECLRWCCEGIGGFIFCILFFIGLTFLAVGTGITWALSTDVIFAVVYFIASKAGSCVDLGCTLPRWREAGLEQCRPCLQRRSFLFIVDFLISDRLSD